MSMRYRLVFRGKFLPGLTADQAALNLTVHFGIDPEMARQMVVTFPGVIRTDLDIEQGNRFMAALANAGLIAHLEPMLGPEGVTLPAGWDGVERRAGINRRSGEDRRGKARDNLTADRRQSRGRRATD